MTSVEKFCLRWNDFHGNVSRSFASIRESNHFFDCTLTTDDDDDDDTYSEYLRAHKVILSASSDLFKKILTKKSLCENPNPVVYLRGISAKDLKHILDFIYHGEVNVAKDELDRFLEVAETLKVHGLTSSVRACKRPAKYLFPSHINPLKKPKLMAVSPSPCTTKREPIDSVMTENIASLDTYENIVGENKGDEEYKEDLFTNPEEVNDEDDRGDGSEDFETRVRENNESAMIEDDYMEGLSGANNDDNENTSFGSTGVVGNEDVIEPWNNEDQASGPIERGGGGDSIEGTCIGKKPGRAKYKKLTGTERVTLINIIKTLDREHLLINAKEGRDSGTTDKRKAIWRQVVPAFNEICGTNFDLKKLRYTFFRIKCTPNSKLYSLIYEDSAVQH